jgi:bifunctional DNA-binding transcriptional regulator/antitoxin component of YhaV-PrlF toxin-antitoxin module
LGLSKRDRLAFFKSEDGHVLLKRVEPQAEEFSVETLAWLDFLRTQHDHDPQSLTPITQELWTRISALTDGIDVDLDKPLSEQ